MRLPAIFLLCLALANAAEVRTWTDVQGRKIEASLARIDGQSVVLKLKDGREVPYPLAKLSDADRKNVEENRALTSSVKSTKNSAEASQPLNFDAPWPDIIRFTEDPEINTVEENVEKKRFIYESANYRYLCDVRLAKSVVKGFAVMFESTHLYCRTLPLGINGGSKTDGKFQILLFEKFEDYVRAGGPASSAGVFIGGKKAVLVPLDSLGVKPVGSSYMLDRDKSSSTIPHELTHQLSPECYFVEGAMGWFSEGIAEYVATTPYRSGIFSVRGNQKPIMEYVTGYGAKDRGGRALGTDIKMPDLKTFMLQDYPSFQEQPQLGYGCGLLMTTYFLHMDGEGDGKRMKAFLKALHDGKEGEEALAFLLDGRTFTKLQEEFTKAWSRKGVNFTFAKP
ncbi:MAG: SHD1 domain-containing protein [Luteolibacter sp.]|uniref:SHD1 domain-containing protein n=1 Tax=Luteolibacter sp. TaxID=1962973 RepID=UPI003266A70A